MYIDHMIQGPGSVDPSSPLPWYTPWGWVASQAYMLFPLP